MKEQTNKERAFDRLIMRAMDENANGALALGFLRYEALRKLKPRAYEDLWKRNLKGENFCGMIDELIAKQLATTDK